MSRSTRARNSAGLLAWGCPPSSCSRWRTGGDSTTARISRFKRSMIGQFDVDLTHEFFQGFVNHAQVTLHIDNLRGENAHHQCETVFKAFGRALRMAAELDPRAAGTIPSTKGSL